MLGSQQRGGRGQDGLLTRPWRASPCPLTRHGTGEVEKTKAAARLGCTVIKPLMKVRGTQQAFDSADAGLWGGGRWELGRGAGSPCFVPGSGAWSVHVVIDTRVTECRAGPSCPRCTPTPPQLTGSDGLLSQAVWLREEGGRAPVGGPGQARVPPTLLAVCGEESWVAASAGPRLILRAAKASGHSPRPVPSFVMVKPDFKTGGHCSQAHRVSWRKWSPV